MTIDELRNKADESLKKIKEEGEELIDRLRRINEHMNEQNKILDKANRKMNIIDHGWKKIDKPGWLEELRALAEYDTIKKTTKENRVYDIDRLFWNEGKLFGYDTHYIDYTTRNGQKIKVGPCIEVKRKVNSDKLIGLVNEREYGIRFTFDWLACTLTLLCCAFNPYICEPVGTTRVITFDTLFGIKPELVKDLVETEIDCIIKEIDRLINDGKKDNRDS